MGYDDSSGMAGKKLLADYERTRTEVRGMFDRIVAG